MNPRIQINEPAPDLFEKWGRIAFARILILVLAQAFGALPVHGASLAERVAEITDTSAAERAFWGIQVVDLDDGRTIYEQHQDKLFLPASNGKLFSTALALSRLGPDYFHTTTVVSKAEIDPDGILGGDLVLLGGGDPNFSSRLIPYNPKKEFASDRLAPLRELGASSHGRGNQENRRRRHRGRQPLCVATPLAGLVDRRRNVGLRRPNQRAVIQRQHHHDAGIARPRGSRKRARCLSARHRLFRARQPAANRGHPDGSARPTSRPRAGDPRVGAVGRYLDSLARPKTDRRGRQSGAVRRPRLPSRTQRDRRGNRR